MQTIVYIILTLLITLVPSVGYAGSHNLGDVKLTGRQKNRLPSLMTGDIKSFQIKGNSYNVLTTKDLSDAEIAQLIADMKNLSDAPSDSDQDKLDFKTNAFYHMTPAQAEAWAGANATGIPGIKDVLGEMAKTLAYLVRRSELND